jgi:hypothetical protein
MHARRGLHPLACSNYFCSFFFWGGEVFGIRDLGGQFDLQEFERVAALLIGRLKDEKKRIFEKCILL